MAEIPFVDISQETKKLEPKDVKPVTKGVVVKKPKTLGRKFADFFFEDMSFKEVAALFITERLLPDLKDGVYGLFDGFLETLFYGKVTKKSGRQNGGTYTSYSSYSGSKREKPYHSTANRVANNFDDIIFESRQDADAVLEEMCILCEKYQSASIGDFYDSARVSRNGFTDNNFGWTSMQGAYVTRGRGGWVICMPKVIELK